MKSIKSELKTCGPKDVVSTVSAKVGGVVEAVAPGQLPRGEMQVRNAKRCLKFTGDKADELFTMMQRSKAGEGYIRDIKSTPDPAILVASDQQLDDLVRFCASATATTSCILTVDPTFCLGDFECTPITYRNLLLVTRRSKVPPIFIGPVLIHYRKNFSSFLFFASSLLGLRKELQCIKSFGTDGEKALVDAFMHEFRFATHLYCTIHARNNVRDELRGRKFPDNVISEVVSSIFGTQVGSTYKEGLVDAESEEVFYQQLEEKRLEWEDIEEKNAGCRGDFYDWFCKYKVDSIVSGMLRPVREDAGLGVPPSAFTTNASESINAVLKRKVDYKKSDLTVFVDFLKQVIDDQQREVERAVLGRGKYEFTEEYKYLQIPEANWFLMTREQRLKHLEKVAKVQLKNSGDSTEYDREAGTSLSVSAEQLHSMGLRIPLASIQGIWKKADEMLKQPNAIVSAPGFSAGSKMVASRTGRRPHLVKCNKGGRISCDADCPNWKSLSICSHCVAVAHVNGTLTEYLNCFLRAKSLPNLSQLLLTGLPSGVGNKGNRVSRKRKRVAVENVLPLSGASSIPGSAETVQAENPSPTVRPPSSTSSGIGQGIHAASSASPSTVSITIASPSPTGPPWGTYPPSTPMALQLNSVQASCGTANYAPPNYTPPGTYGTHPSSWSLQSQNFFLCVRSGNISVCSGCRNKFDRQAHPPNDLCVRHEEWRSFVSPTTNLPDSRYGNAYYHVNQACIVSKWPNFIPRSLIITDNVRDCLLPVHKFMLASTFGILFE